MVPVSTSLMIIEKISKCLRIIFFHLQKKQTKIVNFTLNLSNYVKILTSIMSKNVEL